MATVLNPKDTLQAALARGEGVHEVFIGDWSAYNDLYPAATLAGIPASIAGLSIGPRSDVDRAWVSWNPGAPVLAGSTNAETYAYMRTLSVGAPLLFTQNAASGVSVAASAQIATAMRQGVLRISASNILESVPGVNTVQRVESTALGDSFLAPGATYQSDWSNVDDLVLPRLQLQLLLRQDALVQAAPKRMPFQYRGIDRPVAAGIGTFQAICAVPTYGRKTIVVTAKHDTLTAGAQFSVAAVRGLGLYVNVGIEIIPQSTVEGLLTVTEGEVARFKLCDACADYTVLYYDGDAATLNYTITAYD